MSTSAKATKKSAFSCEPCRRRKVKCGGEQPVCNRCASRQEECVYKLNPTLSYTQRLEKRIKELEDHVATLSKSPISTHPSSSHSSPPSFSSYDVSSQTRLAAENHPSMTRKFRGLKLDERGGVTYHGATSFFHLPSERSTPGNNFLPLTEAPDQRRERLVTNAWQQRALENLSDIPEPFRHLLNVHWCWVHPLFNFVYRPAFARDMQSMGPYYSHTLLNALLSQSIRWGRNNPVINRILDESYQGGAIFGKHARSSVFDELSNGTCTVPTIQTLLLLSANESGLGNATQAWTYSGMAFRLMDHMGICVDNERYVGSVHLSDEDVEIRRRLFWSCYFWDKMISLYLGRSPTIQHTAVSPPHTMFDNSAENDLWVPFGLSGNILVHMYDPLFQNTVEEVEECLYTQEAAFQQWWNELPLFLRIDPNALPSISPPSHIVTMNCLYHTFRILLYRPMLTRGVKTDGEPAPVHSYLFQCVTSATSIIAIFNLFVSTFGIKYCVLSVSYSVYIAATIYLLQVQAFPGDSHALHRLAFCIRVLSEVKKYSPMLGGALNLINKELAALGINMHAVHQALQTSQILPIVNTPSEASMPEMPEVVYGPPVQGEPSQPPPSGTEFLFQAPINGTEGFNPEPNGLDAGVFEAMSTLQPLSAWVGTIPEYNQ
uniref:Zn(2)-C6 fungal-type domain-containing protein n=1 Tax=Bionectria ochroleuca TaxID=29856 RepID=A0A8H7N845_BIOOC